MSILYTKVTTVNDRAKDGGIAPEKPTCVNINPFFCSNECLKFGPIVSPVKALEAVTIVLCPKALPLLAVAHKSSSTYLSGMWRSASRACKAGLKNSDSSAAALFPSLTAASSPTEKINQRLFTQQQRLTCFQQQLGLGQSDAVGSFLCPINLIWV